MTRICRVGALVALVLLCAGVLGLSWWFKGSSKESSSNGTAANKTPVPTYLAPEAKFERVWQLLDENFLHRDRLPTLAECRTRFAPAKLTDDNIETACQAMISALGDEWTTYLNEAATRHDSDEMHAESTVKAQMKDGFLCIKITMFSSNTARELKKALTAPGHAAARGYLINLRGNPGGDLEQALLASSLFCNKGLLQRIEGRHDNKPYRVSISLTGTKLESRSPDYPDNSLDREKNVTQNKPVVVIIDDTTASAAEAFADILRNLAGAKIVGEKSFGKAVCQDEFKVDAKTTMIITFARTYGPSGTCLDGKGLKPDHLVRNVPVTKDLQTETAMKILTEAAGVTASAEYGKVIWGNLAPFAINK